MRTTWNFQTAGQMIFGAGATKRLAAWLQRRGFRRVLIVTDPILIQVGILSKIEDALRAPDLTLSTFGEGEAEPAVSTALRLIAQAADFRPDVLIGLGGGSNMDLAKIAANVITHGGAPRDYFGWDQVPGPILPLVCIPTTAGTGSEVSHAAVLTDTENQLKVSTLSPYLRPALALVDPELTYSCPARVTAASGIDALTHAIEAYTATDFSELPLADGETSAYEGSTPLGSCLAERAIELIGQHLVTAVHEGHNPAARHAMALAATTAGIAFSNCAVAVVHALEYPLGAVLHCSHGAGNGLLLPHVMRFNLPTRLPQFAKIASLLGENVAGLPLAEAAERAIVAVDRLRAAIGVPGRIRELGGTREQLPAFAEKAFGIKRLMMMNPRQPTSQDLLQILEAAY
ncbi:MAG: iron-containing alcohol dehydrogenase [Planctomycetota bacterium]